MAIEASAVLSLCINPAIDLYGEAPHVHAIRKIRVNKERVDPGGGGVNVARVLAVFGEPVNLVYLSAGATGRLLDDMLSNLAIGLYRVEVAGQTRISYNVHERHSGNDYRFVPEGPTLSSAEAAVFFSALENTPLQPGTIVVGSGSLPAGMPSDTYARICDMLTRRGARFVLDTSGAALESAVSDKTSPPFLIKPSIGELERLVESDLDERLAGEAAMELVGSGRVQNVALTMGAHGALLATTERLFRLPGIRVSRRSAVGAGDSFVGGLVYRLNRGDPLPEAFRYAVAAGSAAVMTPGSLLCRPADVEALYRRIKSH